MMVCFRLFILFAVVVFQRGKSRLPRGEGLCLPLASFCYHDNIFNLQQLKPVFNIPVLPTVCGTLSGLSS